MKKILSIAVIGLVAFALTACGKGGGDKAEAGKIIVTGKEFTEQIIMTHMLAEYLKANTDLDVEVKDSLGGVFVIQEAMKKGDVDLYVEYTGTGYLNVLDKEYKPGLSPDQIYDETKKEYKEKFNMAWLKPMGFNNTYALAVRSELAEELGIKTYSDLAKHSSKLSFGSDPEFFERGDGYDALVKEYNYDFAKQVNIDPDLMYTAAKDAEIDVITAFSTDARIKQYNLTVLEDDKNFFPPYYAAPVIRQAVLDANPGLEDTLNKLTDVLDDDRMQELNAQVNIENKEPEDVAVEFLKEEGLID
ncbi:glycine/betaine ABC transporter substrate-binding protein [Lederbergia sp. NSJ-179]|uniref:glycine betaine ABC transporter substrate-binding protein n=1 Tax=Lederbergia sp. NSJ-179 TaxID=2931402 RepID=UPI001FD3509B|nr:glycine betaine ABC transporter substrate-binding protein [Lederbergia sp. NSJ-179]MCJ7842728.1 glycine/betaine ABC transporter substrate-binding protein [Lederbergia sp. NSJ-179]